MTQLTDLQDGSIVKVDGGFTCMKAGTKTVHTDLRGNLFVECDMGMHLLDGQEDTEGNLVGIQVISK